LKKNISIVKKDILQRADVQILVDKFYEKVNSDDLLGPVFSHVDWSGHLPVMYDFWSSLILGDQTYRGNPLQKHVPLPIKNQHFDRWLLLFKETVDEHFDGQKAEEVKMRAESIASIFQHKLGLTT
jgi:hemoglobin